MPVAEQIYAVLFIVVSIVILIAMLFVGGAETSGFAVETILDDHVKARLLSKRIPEIIATIASVVGTLVYICFYML